jgi:nucleotide-binding universal stress UspA family protein
MTHAFNILVAIDYDSPARAAGIYAIRLAKATQSAIRFVHVYEPAENSTTGNDQLAYEVRYGKLKDYVLSLFKLADADPSELNCQYSVRDGSSIKEQLAYEIDDTGADLIITGTHPATSFKEEILGGNTWNIIKNVSVPVLAIPENAVFSGVQKIAFATEYREGEIPAIHFLTRLAGKLDAGVTVLHIADNASVAFRNFETLLFERFRKEVKTKVIYEKLNMQLILHEGIIDGLNEYCRVQGVNWLVMSPDRVTWLDRIMFPLERSTTKRMGFHTLTPLLILPDFYNTEYAEMMKYF